MSSLAEKVYMDLMARGKDIETAGYIGRYRHMQSYRVHKYIMSAGWVFPGWVSWSKWFKQHYGIYPDQKYPGILAKLARMSKSERDEIIMPELMKIEGLS